MTSNTPTAHGVLLLFVVLISGEAGGRLETGTTRSTGIIANKDPHRKKLRCGQGCILAGIIVLGVYILAIGFLILSSGSGGGARSMLRWRWTAFSHFVILSSLVVGEEDQGKPTDAVISAEVRTRSVEHLELAHTDSVIFDNVLVYYTRT
eukprot:3684676-Pyramimonas_sp.AAC.1